MLLARLTECEIAELIQSRTTDKIETILQAYWLNALADYEEGNRHTRYRIAYIAV
jgi:hypothetical protein